MNTSPFNILLSAVYLNHDVWYQIIQYFDHEAKDTDAAEKRRALLNMAVTSRMVSRLALATLWRNMTSLQPLVNVVNSFSTIQADPPLLRLIEDGNGRYWVRVPSPVPNATLANVKAQKQELLKKPSGGHVILRVREYLSRVRLLRIWGENPWERALWPILIAWFQGDEPLLPNLQELAVYFTGGFETSYNYLALMTPPGLKKISTRGSQSSGHLANFYQLLESRGCSLVSVRYTGDSCFPPVFSLFKNLKTLTVSGVYTRHTDRKSPCSLLELLDQLRSLNRLTIDLKTFPIETVHHVKPFEHPSLEVLVLKGTSEELYPFLSFDITCPSVKAISLNIWFNTHLSWKSLSRKVISTFPNVRDLAFQVSNPGDLPQLALSDLVALRAQPMRSFILHVPNKLGWRDLQRILGAWPGIHTLTLTGGQTPFDAKAVLSMTAYQNLHTLNLPFNFIPLVPPLANPPATQKSSLRHIRAAPPTRLPETFKEKISLAQNLLALLPKLESVEMNDKQLGPGASDQQDIIKGMLSVIAARTS